MKKELTDIDYDRVWNKFNKEFEFTPSVEPKYWPGIVEPTPSYTISLSESEHAICPDKQEIIIFLINAFNRLAGDSKIRYILDWNHKCYYAPKIFEKLLWVYPDGDYAICLNKKLDCGTFGHPWEQTICIFGQELIDITRNSIPKNFSKVIRENI